MLYENSLSLKTLSVNEHINLTDSFKISWSRVRKKPIKSKGQVVMHVDFGSDFLHCIIRIVWVYFIDIWKTKHMRYVYVFKRLHCFV